MSPSRGSVSLKRWQVRWGGAGGGEVLAQEGATRSEQSAS
jgi:hypothetical protein